jgi:CRP/FNR family cyclic AMP-dependent transcriptional regulator
MMESAGADHGSAPVNPFMKRNRTPDFDPEVFLAKVGKGRTLASYAKNKKIFSQGEPADAVFYIQSGRVKLTVVSEQGKEAVVAILGAKDFYGEGCLAGQPQRMASASAMSACSIMRLEKLGVVRMLKNEAAFFELFLHHLLYRNIFTATFEWKRIWWINCSIPARSGWLALFF